jgi:hypothetical protein
MKLNRHDVWGHFAPMFHLVDVFAVYAITLVGGRHVIIPSFSAQEALLAIGTLPALCSMRLTTLLRAAYRGNPPHMHACCAAWLVVSMGR